MLHLLSSLDFGTESLFFENNVNDEDIITQENHA